MDEVISRSDPAATAGEAKPAGEHPTMVGVAGAPVDETEAGEDERFLDGYQRL